MVRFLPGGNQVFTAVIDIKTARLSFSRLETLFGQHAAIFRHAKDRNQASGAVTGVQMTTIRCNVNIRCPTGISEISRHHIQRLHTLNLAVRIFQRPDVNGAVQLIHTVGKLLIRMERHMTRARAFNGGHFCRFLRLQMSIIAYLKQTDTILFQRRNPQDTVIR